MRIVSAHAMKLAFALGVIGITASAEAAAKFSLQAVKKNGVGIGHCSVNNAVCGGPANCPAGQICVGVNNLSVLPGDSVEADIFASGWGAELPLGVRAFQAKLDGTGFVDGVNGAILPLGWNALITPPECDTDLDCPPSYPVCYLQRDCVQAGHDPDLGVPVDINRPDFIFLGLDTIAPVDLSSLNYRYSRIGVEQIGVVDNGTPKYCATLKMNVKSNACGTFPVGFLTKGDVTYLADPSGSPNVIYPASEALVMTVAEANCNKYVASCSPSHCYIDSRRRTPPNALLPVETTNQMTMTFSKPPGTMAISDFEVTVLSHLDPPPTCTITTVAAPVGNDVLITLQRRLFHRTRFCVRHKDSNRQCCMGHLQGDADLNLTAGFADVFEALDNLDGSYEGGPMANDQCDADRSNLCTGADLLTIVDFMTGADIYEPGNGHTIPECVEMIIR